ncbi:uncharacterized protein LOC141631543 [Silene latifolia]|uniref:uncharacterized protein LOC141631543 n=1 Tax=Silene latifolia TaxID=37657 RepID=UPI003D77DC3F
MLKGPLKKLNREGFGDILNTAEVARMVLEEKQAQLHLDPQNLILQIEERVAAQSFKELQEAKHSFLGQKAKINWMQCNDENTHYFHSSIKTRRAQKKRLLGSSERVTRVNLGVVRRANSVSDIQASAMAIPVIAAEVRSALFSVPNEKAPGPDVFSSIFFKDAYDIIGEDVVRAVMKFFTNGQLLHQINATVLTLIPKKEGFRFHPMCKALNLCHMSFADDLLIFCRGDPASVTVIMRAMITFSEASGLHINKDKSDIYMNGVAATNEQAIPSISGFKKGYLPFKYLGITISYKRISNVECSLLVDKLVARIRGWGGGEHLSYAGRLLLVKAVLTEINSYWPRIFLLPKAIIHKVESICRAYLWSGTEEHHKAPAVSWDKCYLPKSHGGLGILNCYNCNISTLGKYIWWVANKKDCLWARWALYSTNVVYKWLSGDHLKETSLHLFFECPFSKRCLHLVQQWLGFCWTNDVIARSLTWRGRSLLRKKIKLAALASLVYFIWEGRNKCRVEAWVPHLEHIKKRMHDVLSGRITSLRMEKVHSRDMNWVKEIGLR